MLLATIASSRLSAQEVAAGSSREDIANLDAPEPVPTQASDASTRRLWDAGLGYAFVRFNSSLFTANTSGLLSFAGFHLSDHVALEEQITSTMGDPNPGPFDSKYFFYGGGARLSGGVGKTRPFLHVLVGGLHLFPQTQFSNNSAAVMAGGGTDVRWNSEMWVRLESDYVRSQLYRNVQSNFQFAIGLYHTF